MTVGIVIVSHSARLAEGVAELAKEMGGTDVPIALAAGLDQPGQPLGTDALLVQRAIEALDNPDGVLVLVDLGSAILSTEMALDLLTDEVRARVRLCPAPLVEGTLAAAVQARLGSSIEQVYQEALNALAPKRSQMLIEDMPEAFIQPIPGASATDEVLRLTVPNRLGFHARPAARLVQTAARYNADIRVSNLTRPSIAASVRSINALMTSDIRYHDEVEFRASGDDAVRALAAIEALAAENFGDDETPPKPITALAATTPAVSLNEGAMLNTLVGIVASPGIAMGEARFLRVPTLKVPTERISDPDAEWQRLAKAIDQTRVKVQAAWQTARAQVGRGTAAIFEAHLLFLDDNALLEPTHAAIVGDKLNAAAAWQQTYEDLAQRYSALEAPYLQERAADLRDVGRQVLSQLMGVAITPTLSEPGVLLADDLTPSDTAGLDKSIVKAICTVQGGPTSHSAIIANAMGIPAVVGLGEQLMTVGDGTPLFVDGDSGRVFINPLEETRRSYVARIQTQARQMAVAQAAAHSIAQTRDDRRIEVFANIGGIDDARAAVEAGAEGVGLFRTEFLFLDRTTAPSEEEQYQAYAEVAAVLDSRPMVLRTLDIGGDKPLPYINLGQESNPFLGWRAIRVSLDYPEMFRVQLRAVLRAAAEYPIKLMFPMVATLDELQAARQQVALAREELAQRGIAAPDNIETGIMVEIPSTAIQADVFAREVDFFSVGTNDLTQYTLAAERGNSRVAALSDAFSPAVLTLMAKVAEAASTQGKWAGVCGELAGNPLAALPLVGMGYTELSMSPASVARVKQTIRRLHQKEIAARIPELLAMRNASDVRVRLRQWLSALPETER